MDEFCIKTWEDFRITWACGLFMGWLLFSLSPLQLILIHRTIVSYKTRHQAFVDCYGSNSNANDSKILVDLAFSRKFHPAWPNRSLEWSSEQKYPYRLPGLRHPPINHIWKTICPQTPSTLSKLKSRKKKNLFILKARI